ncbi:MAG TPA: helix-turn-helix domain-containing protein [Trebonia sp.]|nr:helix-turn-helix domain-containing protein [Trebonia sp.]
MTESGQETAGGPRRKDAQRNHERVVAAAVEAFREYGSAASVPQIAARAGVGKATVYRSYPAKEDLLEAITRLSLDELRQRTTPALRETDAYEGFRRYVLELFDALARDRLLAERLSDTASAAAASMLETLAARMEQAQTAGRVRADATEQDLRVFLCGAALQLLRLGETEPVTWRRCGEMVLAAFQPMTRA